MPETIFVDFSLKKYLILRGFRVEKLGSKLKLLKFVNFNLLSLSFLVFFVERTHTHTTAASDFLQAFIQGCVARMKSEILYLTQPG